MPSAATVYGMCMWHCAIGTYMLPEHTGVKIEWPKKKSSVMLRGGRSSCHGDSSVARATATHSTPR